MSLRKRQNQLPKCNSERISASECEISENVNVLSSTSADCSNNVEELQSNIISNNLILSGNTCDNEASRKLHRKMKKNPTSKSSPTSFLRKDCWSTGHITSALRLGLSVFVIIIFLLSLTQIQNVEGQHQRNSHDQVQQKKIPNDQ